MRFAVLSCVFGLAVLVSAAALAEKKSAERIPPGEEIVKKIAKSHPRLLIDAAGFEALKKRVEREPAFRELADKCRREADKQLKTPLPEHVLPDGKRLLATSRRVVDDAYSLAMAYRLTGDRRYLDRLWSVFETVSKFSDFNPKHFLDTAEMTHALAIGYDWLYRDWKPEQRAVIRKAMVRMGLEPGLAVYQKKSGWHTSVHNWNQVCNGGLTAGALALGDEEPKLAAAILENAIKCVPRAMASYAPDGAWGEGPGYWGYATRYNVLMLACLQSALGTDYGLSALPGFAETGLFPVYITGPTNRSFNFEDSGDGAPRDECLYWLARRFNLPVCAWFAAQGRPHAQGLIWHPDRLQDPIEAKMPLDKFFRGVEVATFRGKWNDPKTTFVGFLAGDNRVNHNHLDSGSFVLDALSVRWGVDLGGDDYNLPGYFGGQRYDYYRLRAESHNTLVIDPGKGPDQNPKAAAKMRRFESKPDRAFAVADLTPVYNGATRVERGVALLKRQNVLVQDEIEAKSPVDAWWFFHTTAKIKIDDNGRRALLTQGKESLTVTLVAPGEAKFEVRPAESLPSSPQAPAKKSNKGFQTLAVHFPKSKTIASSIYFSPGDKPPALPKADLRPLSGW